MQSMFDERQWLSWLAKVRIIILTFLLGIELAISRFTYSPIPLKLFVVVILLWYTISLIHLMLLPVWQENKIQSLLQVFTDLLMVTVVVYITGGVDSSLNFLYPLVIIVGSILLPRRWAYLSAGVAFVFYGAVLDLSYFGSIPSFSTTHPELRALQAIILVNLFAYIAIAYLTTLLVAKLRQVNVTLKRTSGALENLQAIHENIIHSITGGLLTTELDGAITLINSAAQKVLQYSETDLLGKSIHQLFLDPLPHAGSERALGEVRFVAPNNFRKTFRVTASTLNIPDRGTIGYVYTFDDLTEIRRLERDLRTQDRLAAVGRLAAGIAHEIRNPLTSIAGSVSMLSEIPDLSDEHLQLLKIVTRESERLNGIITDFLAYSRSRKYEFSRVDLLPLIEDALTLLQHRLKSHKYGIRIERQFKVSNAFALVDGDRMKQVFWNFCENAVRAMKQGGILTVSVDILENQWEISFADTGPGIDPRLMEKIFEPFQSQFEGGTGLGLAIVYQIVQAHEGRVWARSKPGQGSVFVLRLARLSEAECDGGSANRRSQGSDENISSQALKEAGMSFTAAAMSASGGGGAARG